MLWLQSPPWGRWFIASALVAVAFWMELGPDPETEHPFARGPIPPGTEISASDTEMRKIPEGLLEPVELVGVAAHPIGSGEPILVTDLTDARNRIPPGWWIVGVEVPSAARPGDRVRVVLIDDGATYPGIVVATGDDDPFSGVTGSVAVAEEHASSVARAAAGSRIAVLISTG